MTESSEKAQPPVESPTAQTESGPKAELQPRAPIATDPFEIAVLALQNLTLFPETVVPLGVGRPRSIAAVEAALATPEKLLACVTARPNQQSEDEARPADLYDVGTLVMIKRMERIGDGIRIIV